MLADAERLGRALASRHPPGARIAVYANNVPEWVLLELGCALAGVTLVTVNPAYQTRELNMSSSNRGPRRSTMSRNSAAARCKAIAEEACAELPAIRHRILLTDHAALFDGEDAASCPRSAPGDVAQIQ